MKEMKWGDEMFFSIDQIRYKNLESLRHRVQQYQSHIDKILCIAPTMRN